MGRAFWVIPLANLPDSLHNVIDTSKLCSSMDIPLCSWFAVIPDVQGEIGNIINLNMGILNIKATLQHIQNHMVTKTYEK